MHAKANTHLNVILPRKISEVLIFMPFRVSAIFLMVIPMGVVQFNLAQQNKTKITRSAPIRGVKRIRKWCYDR